jgi:hypothetical protein
LARRRLHSSARCQDSPGIDLVDLRLQLRIFLGLGREQLPSQGGQALISLDALYKSLDALYKSLDALYKPCSL